MKMLDEIRGALSIALGLVSIYLFFTNNVADAIYFLVWAVWMAVIRRISMNVKPKSRFMQLFCKHDYQCFQKPIDKKTNPYGFVSLNNVHMYVCIKCGRVGARTI